MSLTKIIIYIVLFAGIILLIMRERKIQRIDKELEEQLKVMNKQKERWLKKIEEGEKFFEKLDEKIKEMEHRKKSYEQGVCDDIVDEEKK